MIVDTLRIHSNNLNKKHYLLHEVIEFVSWVTLQGFDRTPKIVFAIRYITLFFLLNF